MQGATAAVFIFIGSDPKNSLVQGLGVAMDDVGYVETNQRMETGSRACTRWVTSAPARSASLSLRQRRGDCRPWPGQYIDEHKGEQYK